MEKRRDFIKKASLLSIGLPLMGAMGCKGDTKGAAAVKSVQRSQGNSKEIRRVRL